MIGEGLGLAGTGFIIESSLEEADAALHLTTPPSTLASGAFADFSGLFTVGNSIGATFGGIFGLITAPMTLSFNAAPMSLSCSGAGSSTQCTGNAPFTFNATLTFTPSGADPVTRQFIGDGIVGATVFPVDAQPFGGVHVDFEASPTPEPATLPLFATGVMAAVAAVWRRGSRVIHTVAP